MYVIDVIDELLDEVGEGCIVDCVKEERGFPDLNDACAEIAHYLEREFEFIVSNGILYLFDYGKMVGDFYDGECSLHVFHCIGYGVFGSLGNSTGIFDLSIGEVDSYDRGDTANERDYVDYCLGQSVTRICDSIVGEFDCAFGVNVLSIR